jgi:hypothetical protein
MHGLEVAVHAHPKSMTHPDMLDAVASGSTTRPKTAFKLEHRLYQGSFCTGLEPLLKAAGVLRPLAIGAGAGALGLAALTKNTASRDEKERRNALVYTPMTGMP